MEPAGEAQERETPSHLKAHKIVKVGREAKDTTPNRVRWRTLVEDLCSIRNDDDDDDDGVTLSYS